MFTLDDFDRPWREPVRLGVDVLEVTDYHDLLALNRALMEVRYLARDVDDATRGSSFLSNLHVRVINAIKENLHEAGTPGHIAQWDEWQVLSRRSREIPKILEYLSAGWSRLASVEAKREALINQLRPFTFTDEEVEELSSRLDQMVAEGANE